MKLVEAARRLCTAVPKVLFALQDLTTIRARSEHLARLGIACEYEADSIARFRVQQLEFELCMEPLEPLLASAAGEDVVADPFSGSSGCDVLRRICRFLNPVEGEGDSLRVDLLGVHVPESSVADRIFALTADLRNRCMRESGAVVLALAGSSNDPEQPDEGAVTIIKKVVAARMLKMRADSFSKFLDAVKRDEFPAWAHGHEAEVKDLLRENSVSQLERPRIEKLVKLKASLLPAKR